MQLELKPEDFIVTESDGRRRINHEVLESYGLFNLPRNLMRNALVVYYDNAARQGKGEARKVQTFIRLATCIAHFPRAVVNNFSRGEAYRRNMQMLKRFSG